MKYIDLEDVKIPALGFGTYLLKGNECVEAVADAISLGYRHIDTAEMYGNEAETGEGIRKSGIRRDDLFITTKVWVNSMEPYAVRRTTRRSLEYLQTDYLDLLLIHFPSVTVPLEDTLAAMDRLRREGKTRFLGVSNFNIALMKRAEMTGIPLITNQVEYHALLSQEKMLHYLSRKGLFLTAYSPVAKGRLANHPVLEEIGKKHKKTAVQVALRWLIQQDNVATIPKASDSKKRRKNLDIFDFELDSRDLERIAFLEKNRRIVDIPGLSPDWD